MSAVSELDFTCAFCGLACDDLRVRTGRMADSATGRMADSATGRMADSTIKEGMMTIVSNGCAISERALATLSAIEPRQSAPRVNGAQADLAQAIEAARAILRRARQPLFAGLATDVAGARAVMRLAERCGAVTDHMNFGAKLRNVLVTQDRGWITTTFAEVKNRADFVLIVGGDPSQRFPRFFERLIDHADGMFGAFPAPRELVLLGSAHAPQLVHAAASALPCEHEAIGAVAAALRMLVREHAACARLPAQAGGIALTALRALAAKLKAAKYGVIVWAAVDFNFPHAELTIQRIAELVKDVNAFTRCAGLPLGGSDGDLTMNQVHVWQSGFALRSDFGRGHADYDPYANGAAQILARGEADALLWISSFNATRLPPVSDVPQIVLARADMRCEREPAVFIPVGVPGVDHAGHFVRSDKVVTMRLGKLRDSALPSVASVVTAIEQTLCASERA